jgi:hypothetical protein
MIAVCVNVSAAFCGWSGEWRERNYYMVQRIPAEGFLQVRISLWMV